MKLRLIRLVIASLGAKLDCSWNYSANTESQIMVELCGPPQRPSESRTTLLLRASRPVDSIPSDGNVIHVPEDSRRDLEMVLESFIDVLAVFNQCTRSLASPHPYIAIEPLDDEGKSWLRDKRIHVSTSGIPARMWHEFDLEKSVPQLHGRLDGVALIAESLSHSNPTGRLHELMRLFERAFALPAGRLCRNELPEFLEPNDKGYTAAELARWLELRDTSVHADRRPHFAVQADTRPVVNRMEQAAYDVLFNKAHWRDRSIDRRSVFQPYCGSSANNSDMFMTKGQPFKSEVPVVDGFHAYPIDFDACITTIPEHWLARTTAQREQQPEIDAAG